MKGLGSGLAESYRANSLAWLVLAASVVELIAAGIVCTDYHNVTNENCKGYEAWAVAVGAISVALSLMFVILSMVDATLATSVAPAIAALLVLLWIPGAFLLTFAAPFTVTSNGYYAAWAAFILSILFCRDVGILSALSADPTSRAPAGV